jgi:cytochrome c oxidase subunit IV
MSLLGLLFQLSGVRGDIQAHKLQGDLRNLLLFFKIMKADPKIDLTDRTGGLTQDLCSSGSESGSRGGNLLWTRWWTFALGKVCELSPVPAQLLASQEGLLFMEMSPSWEANGRSDAQEIPIILWTLNVHYLIHKSPPLVLFLSHMVLSKLCHSLSLRCILILPYQLWLGHWSHYSQPPDTTSSSESNKFGRTLSSYFTKFHFNFVLSSVPRSS